MTAYTKEYVLSFIGESRKFAEYVTSITRKYIEAQNLPSDGMLFDFSVDEKCEYYTIKYKFIFCECETVNILRIPVSMLFET